VLTGGGPGDVGDAGDASIRTCVELVKNTLEVWDSSVRTVGFSCSPVLIKFAEGSTGLTHQLKVVFKFLRRTMDMHCNLGACRAGEVSGAAENRSTSA
jgi:hypothetical protein